MSCSPAPFDRLRGLRIEDAELVAAIVDRGYRIAEPFEKLKELVVAEATLLLLG